ncbi:toxin YoeB [Myroides guanonis]|uniref:Putative mRNA interferase YoeB n=2 Tax=Myroides guanonis TaxID=1150112 RepID=A0A1I3LLB2_9FLAO|nr:toxin YoeB [Myroides guanonis]
MIFSDEAKNDMAKLKKSEPQAFKKLQKLLIELTLHPYTGTGKVKLLRHRNGEQLVRKITDKHRLIYTILDDMLIVNVLNAYGHYLDK